MNKKDVTREMLDTIRSMSPKVFNEQAIVYKQRNILKEEEEKLADREGGFADET